MSLSISELVRGQNNIDRMKDEIDTTFRLCFSNIKPEEFPSRSTEVSFGDEPTGKWTVIFFGSEFVLHCWTAHYGLIYSAGYGGPHGNRVQPNLKYVAAMYQVLPIFLNGMLKQFPFLDERLDPYRIAALIKF